MTGISIVVPNARDLPHLLCAQLQAQLTVADEILVVRSKAASGAQWIGLDRTRTATGHVNSRHSQTRCFHATAPGVSNARNLGFAISKNDWVLFLDDDITVSETFLSDVRRTLFEFRNARVVTFRVTAAHKDLSERDAIISLDRGCEVRLASPELALRLHNVWRFGVGAAMVAHKGVIRAIGGFNPLLGAGMRYGGGEDLFFILCAARIAPVVYYGRIQVGHPTPKTLRDTITKIRQYGRAIAACSAYVTFCDGLRTVLGYCIHIIRHSSIILRSTANSSERIAAAVSLFVAISETACVYSIRFICIHSGNLIGRREQPLGL